MTEQTIPSSIATELGVVGIAGTGLLGASIGLRLREHGVRVIGFDVDASSSDTALRRGAIDDIAERFSALANSVDTLILATPIDVVCLQLNELTQSSAFSDGGIGASNGTFAKDSV